ncbi:universal stress protein [Halobacteriales archaeon QH_10_70_21]|jgi:nucleotide-binding universal stress UspA family protein|nr:MAG: universal stress protein [Halobacteriales archaeon QH_10_70_21]
MYDDILIATDGSKKSELSVDHGLDLAEAFDAHVHALYVIETEATYILTVGLGDDEMEEYEEYGEETVSDVAERAAERGLDATGVVRTGTIAAEIDDYAEENGMDLIVMGKQGRGAIEKYLGSTAEKVARMSDTPVTIVGPGAD